MISIASLLSGTVPQSRRMPEKPILEPRQTTKLWWERNGVFNPGVAEYNGKVVLLYRAYDDFHISRLGYAESSDGVTFTQRDLPGIDTDPDDPYERMGIEDPRITEIDGTYYIVHASSSYYAVGHPADVSGVMGYIPWRVRVSMKTTTDFRTFKQWGVILPDVPAKNASVLPELIDGKFALYYREHVGEQEVLKIVLTKDFKHWSDLRVVAWPHAKEWQQFKFGIGSQAISVKEGFLMVYHAVDAQHVYRLGLMLFDRQDPAKILWHSDSILEPTMPYEKEGFVPNVVYTCGALLKNNELWIYYGAADHVIGRAVLSLAGT